jgi:hypothetical protein
VLFYFPFIFLQVFVFMNMVIAIILDGYTRMKEEREIMVESYLKQVVTINPWNQLWGGCIRLLRPLPFLMPASFAQVNLLYQHRSTCVASTKVLAFLGQKYKY